MRELAAFLGIAVVVIVTPGQDTALTIRNTLAGGRRAGVFTALGVSAGQAVWTVAASVGIAALLVASEPAFLALKLAGAAYLVYLGAQAIVRAVRAGGLGDPTGSEAAVPATMRPATAFRHGLVSNLGNPKMAAFFTSLLPQFTETDAPFGTPLLLGVLFCAMTLTWLSGYAFVIVRASALVRRSGLGRALHAVAGVVLIALGIRLATATR